MKAPVSEQRLLLELQAADTRLTQLIRVENTLPQDKPLKELEEQLRELSRDRSALMGETEDIQREISRTETDAQTVHARIVRDRARRDASASPKDIQGLEHELLSLAKRESDLEDIQLALMERAENANEQLSTLAEKQEALLRDQKKLQQSRAQQIEEILQERNTVQAERDRIAGLIGAELLALYERQRQRYGIGAALLTRGVSLGSNVKLHESDLAKIRAADPDDVILDPDSNCILVRTEESGV